MRLPIVSLTFAAGVLLLALCPDAAASEPVMAFSCMDIFEPKFVEEVAAPPATAAPAAEARAGEAHADEVRPAPAARPVPTPLDAQRLADPDGYRAVYQILSAENSCSDFYGGPAKATTAFNKFFSRLKRGRLDDPTIALRMTGTYTRYQDHATGAAYRIFDQATLNSDGPVTSRGGRMMVGRYPGNSAQARALVLLHELGHLVQGPKGWLLPNDGGDLLLSTSNTRLIEAHCAGQLEAISEK
jgi:hypothetical protein